MLIEPVNTTSMGQPDPRYSWRFTATWTPLNWAPAGTAAATAASRIVVVAALRRVRMTASSVVDGRRYLALTLHRCQGTAPNVLLPLDAQRLRFAHGVSTIER